MQIGSSEEKIIKIIAYYAIHLVPMVGIIISLLRIMKLEFPYGEENYNCKKKKKNPNRLREAL